MRNGIRKDSNDGTYHHIGLNAFMHDFLPTRAFHAFAGTPRG